MKIIELFIEDFGKLHHYAYKFNDSLNVVLEDNGFGKTTLAVFIKCMFYGIKGRGSAINDDNERMKYYTFGVNSNIGGTLTYELNGIEYKIERSFGKTAKDDTFKVYNLKTNKLENLPEDLGIELFGVDSSAFERSTYLPQKALAPTENGSLISKISNILEGDNLNNIDTVVKYMEEEEKVYFKSNGRSGKIAENKNRIIELKEQIADCEYYEIEAEKAKNILLQTEIKLNEFSAQLKEVEEKIADAIESNAYLEQYKKVLDGVFILKEELSKYKKFDDTNISLDTIHKYLILSQELVKINSSIQAIQSSITQSNVEKYQDLFKDNTPAIEDIDKKIILADKIETELTKNSFKQNSSILAILQYLFITFGVVFILSLFIYTINISIAIMLNTILGLALLGTGISYLVLKKMKKSNLDTTLENKIDELNLYLKQYGYIGDYKNSLYKLKSDVMLYTKLLDDSSLTNEKLQDLFMSKEKVEIALHEFVKNYYDNYSDNYFELLNDLKNRAIHYQNLKETLTLRQNELQGLSTKNINENVSIEQLKIDQERLQESIKTLVENKTNTINTIKSYQSKSNSKQDLIQEKVSIEEIMLEDISKYETLIKAKEFIMLAKDNLCSKYLKPLTDNFNKHATKITNGSIAPVNINTNLDIYLVENSKNISIEYYSKGFKNIVDICLRLAFIDTLFLKTKPFIILDDPFINLDNKKVVNMVNVIKEISKEYQIIYLVCNDSRV